MPSNSRIGSCRRRPNEIAVRTPTSTPGIARRPSALVANIADAVELATTLGEDHGDVLVLGWGSTRGAITSAVLQLQKQGHSVSASFLRWLNPLPKNLGELMKRFKKVLLPELNKGQLCMMLRAKYLVDVESVSKVDGQPFKSHEILARLTQSLQSLKNQGASR